MTEFLALFKFSEKRHLLALQKEGHLHCETLQYFSDIEDTIGRGDSLETVTDLYYLDENTIVNIKNVGDPDSEYKRIKINSGQLINRGETNIGNIFCLYSIRLHKFHLGKEFTIPVECKSLGDHYLIIKDANEFLTRVKNKLTELKLDARYGYIQYKDFLTYTGKKTIFEKDIKLSYQNEFRLFIHNSENKVLDIKIGSIEDISSIGICEELTTVNFFDNNNIS
ncbi:hypothetical protein [Mucilaginibacter polytrichastri]|uniref:Uncharacterized protein n=1 Tax=Mucilaginibacter polytrichastri TaxID=1302689 RepID=A0A1Q6A1K2_9SPHI|nr:hypothetical protein [Mucilaginibacter polytrichastri]OKS87896.1 hypothetical protein RG47T_3359 [Mucilaginibacter polytrichastri]SFT23085.1 hypothetical protein SAMN04487890_1203 [Mucilaginibacter polytrichastri]